MTDIVNEFFHKHYPADLKPDNFEYTSSLGGMIRYRDAAGANIFPRIKCVDGFTMSVQGHAGAYSTPRDDFAVRYCAVEIGFPSGREELIMKYIDGGDDTDPTQTVYGYVPIKVVVEVIEKHGGIAQ
jgi:hypothetical protein